MMRWVGVCTLLPAPRATSSLRVMPASQAWTVPSAAVRRTAACCHPVVPTRWTRITTRWPATGCPAASSSVPLTWTPRCTRIVCFDNDSEIDQLDGSPAGPVATGDGLGDGAGWLGCGVGVPAGSAWLPVPAAPAPVAGPPRGPPPTADREPAARAAGEGDAEPATDPAGTAATGVSAGAGLPARLRCRWWLDVLRSAPESAGGAGTPSGPRPPWQVA